MQTLDIDNPGLLDLQFVLLMLALCTADLETLNIPIPLRETVFNRCWALLHDTPPPTRKEDRQLDLRQWDEVTLEALVEVIRRTLSEAEITTVSWDHPPSEPMRTS